MILLALGFAALIGYSVGYFCGKSDGVSKGYVRGRHDADNWWIRAESEAEKERQEIWREE